MRRAASVLGARPRPSRWTSPHHASGRGARATCPARSPRATPSERSESRGSRGVGLLVALAELSVERREVDPERLGRADLVLAVLLEDTAHVRPLEGPARGAEVVGVGPGDAALAGRPGAREDEV